MAASDLMKLLSVNVSLARNISYNSKVVKTGIFKEPICGMVRVHSLGLAGDEQADLRVHGGIYKAVYSYPAEHYETWSRELNRNDFSFGQFGENLTTIGLNEDNVHIGDMFRMGDVLLEVTQPREPCFKLAIRMNRPDFPKLFTASGRTGFYQRVLAGGEIKSGDSIERVKTDMRGVTVRQMMRLMHIDRENYQLMEKAILIPALAPDWRDELRERLRARI